MEFDKSRVFTALNADEIKVGSKGYFADSIMILKETIKETLKDSCAAAYGEIDEIKDDSCACRFSIKKNSAYSFFYLVEEPGEKKFRPYNDVDEMVEDFMKRFNENVPPYAMPLIWIKTKGTDKKYLIVRFASDLTICLNFEVYTPTFEDLVEGYTYLDGSPCGIEEDEE